MRRATGLVLLCLTVLLAACGTQVDSGTRRRLAAAQLAGAGGAAGPSGAGEGLTGAGDGSAATGSGITSAGTAGTGTAGTGTTGTGTAGTGTTGTGTSTGTTGATAGGPASGASTGTATGGTRASSPHPAGSTAPSAGASAAATLPAGGNGGATDVGVTGDTILLGNVSDLSGPQPGLFQSAVAGTNAYIAYVNSTGGIFGRRLKISVADGQTSCEGDRAGQAGLVDKVFAFAGSFSLFDQCGATVMAQHLDVPNAQLAVTPEANALANDFSVVPVGSTLANGPYAWAAQKLGADAVQHAAIMYANLPAVNNVAALTEKTAQSVGWKFVYSRAVGATETDFTADIIQMRSRGIKVFLSLFDADEMANFKPQADQQGFKPTVMDTLVYDQSFFSKLGGSAAAEGIYGFNGSTLFFSPQDAAIPSVALFQKWYPQVAGGIAADTFAADAWAETALLVQAMKAAGPHLTRKAVLAELGKTTSFSADGFFATANPAQKIAGNCYVIWQIQGGQYVRVDTPATGYRCDGKQD